MLRNWQKFQRLSWAEKFLLAQALFLLPVNVLGLRILGFRRWQSVLERMMISRRTNTVDVTTAQGIACVINLAAAQMFRAVCLPRSMTLWWMLRQRGIASELRIGVRKEDDIFTAHAWLECQGIVLNDSAEVSTDFTAFTPAEKIGAEQNV
jgi:Transglutaminase-like superfamily